MRYTISNVHSIITSGPIQNEVSVIGSDLAIDMSQFGIVVGIIDKRTAKPVNTDYRLKIDGHDIPFRQCMDADYTSEPVG